MRTLALAPLALLPLALLPLALAACAGVRSLPAPELGVLTAPDGLELVYDTAGEGSPTLVLVHGWAGDRHLWDGVEAGLSRDHRVVRLDLAGHGESAADRDEWTIDALAADLVALLETLDLREVVLVGHSLGGFVVLAAAPAAQERVEAVVAIDTILPRGVRLEQAALTELDESLDADFAGGLRGAFTAWWGGAPNRDGLEEVIATGIATDPAVARALLVEFGEFDLDGALSELPVPVAAITAVVEVPEESFAPLRAEVPGNRLVVRAVANAGHWPQVSRPAEFEGVLREALAELGRFEQ